MDEAWSVPDVYLLTTESEGELAVPHLTLTFLDSGLELEKADGERVWDCGWSDLEEMSPVERSVLPDVARLAIFARSAASLRET